MTFLFRQLDNDDEKKTLIFFTQTDKHGKYKISLSKQFLHHESI